MSDVKSALTPDEWAKWGFSRDGLIAERFRDLFVGNPTRNMGVQLTNLSKRTGNETYAIEPTGAHALAALSLYGQPFGFTHEDVALLHRGSSAIVSLAADGYGDQQEANAASDRIDQLAARIAALLPPKHFPPTP